jgi:hypothetical protein
MEVGTPSYRAAQWIINEDPMRLTPADENLFQRFMLAFLWFHTTNNGDTKWRSCNPPENNEDDRCVFEVFSRTPLDEIYFVPLEDQVRWLSGENECSWVGVECAGGPTVLGVKLCKSTP